METHLFAISTAACRFIQLLSHWNKIFYRHQQISYFKRYILKEEQQDPKRRSRSSCGHSRTSTPCKSSSCWSSRMRRRSKLIMYTMRFWIAVQIYFSPYSSFRQLERYETIELRFHSCRRVPYCSRPHRGHTMSRELKDERFKAFNHPKRQGGAFHALNGVGSILKIHSPCIKCRLMYRSGYIGQKPKNGPDTMALWQLRRRPMP
ncbi:uncharacterized protein PV06_03739 [Exophiala oligosperma]|uniref:Uncharacterized protein n=1 Tax=Exophiala oligosperma TaxID=215243 RepID=A0A0D2AZT6_9EURO|nr:uncharacterized protein PV06_03739 [Exophiala oligosperma]KIW45341.1 hypothetical protein PV06_03739 [Exophiala oligosperma]